jgi:hypothetical protein
MQIPFKKINVIIILAGLAMIALGYLFMGLEKHFIDASAPGISLALDISPPLIIIGHVVVVVGVVFRAKGPVSQLDDDAISKT